MLSQVVLALALLPASAFITPSTSSSTALKAAETKEDLVVLAEKLNPVVGYFDPLNIGTGGLDNNNIAKNADVPDEYLIGWFRHAEIKHGRVAMAAFLGYIVQSNTHWSFAM